MSKQYGVNRDLFQYVVAHESGYDPTEVGDTDIICPSGPFKGQPVYARGLGQITRCYHPEITDAQAFDPDFTLQWMIPIMKNKQLCLKEYTTCRWYYK